MFRYPKTKHLRQHSLTAGRTNRFYKPYLREEFDQTCVYCRMSDGLQGLSSFGVEHYKPVNAFLVAKDASYCENLFYACNCCNSRKGDYWPTEVERQEGRFIPNPCDHIMFDHLRYHSAEVESRTLAGQCAVDILGLDNETEIATRQFVLDLVAALSAQLQQVNTTIGAIREKEKRRDDRDASRLRSQREEHETRAARLTSHLERLGVRAND